MEPKFQNNFFHREPNERMYLRRDILTIKNVEDNETHMHLSENESPTSETKT